jgi:hypothetical protein
MFSRAPKGVKVTRKPGRAISYVHKPARKETSMAGTNCWRTRQGRVLQSIAIILCEEHDDRHEVLRRFKSLVPEYQSYFEFPVTDWTIWHRARLCYRNRDHVLDKSNEWHEALEIIEAGTPVHFVTTRIG